MRIRNLLPLLLSMSLVTLFAGCSSVPSASPTPYQSATGKQGYGYSSVQLSESEYRIMFKATEATPADMVQQYSVLRAAELAEEQGYQYLAVVKTDVETKPALGRKVVKGQDGQVFPPEQQCTMSGCTEPGQINQAAANDVQVETTPMKNVYYSILVRMGNSEQSTGSNALLVRDILADRPDAN
ncbi:CC0125/CC1285 family lipoprotein [Alteromonas halophila]|uniref:DUF4136 domain-containing protein n=1 Tax=Alteromonas halophila TaxID=516698 RepID=A0A918MZJ2_9ALTE|nr:hypothetical protein [Alteromonas halophila]GGW89936.1 hypothetical protein GCM10007391_25340 [Alteromonas halophila]